jgi:hypothetical protein
VGHQFGGQWTGGLIAHVTVTDLGTPVNNWTTSWTAPGGQKVLQGWNADIRQSRHPGEQRRHLQDLHPWYGGMAHEMGHALGLPDSTYTDGTPMSASSYSYPNCHFTQSQKQGILTGPWAKFRP